MAIKLSQKLENAFGYLLRKGAFLLPKSKRHIIVSNVTGSVVRVTVNDNPNIIQLPDFVPSIEWFNRLLSISFDSEIQSKYIPELHQESRFEREELNDIINFKYKIGIIANQVRVCQDYIGRFRDSYNDFYQVLVSEEINIANPVHPYIVQTQELFNKLTAFSIQLEEQQNIFLLADYRILREMSKLVAPVLAGPIISFNKEDWANIIDKKPSEDYFLQYLFKHHNQVYYELNNLNGIYNHFLSICSYKIISGSAGTGKTHMSAYLVKRIQEQGDYVIFFKPKQFSGDDVNLNSKLLELLQVPQNFSLHEILERLDDYSKIRNKRCFLIIDALNETTRSSIGFSSIWANHLPAFINLLKQYPNLYLICTLRTSYIDHIWPQQPSSLVKIEGFGNKVDTIAAVKKYFEFYKINVTNFDKADLQVFSIPLLLDLYCKLINEERITIKEITLGMNTYLQVFEEYIENLVKQVKQKLNLQMSRPIIDGFRKNAQLFLSNNQAVLPIDDFSSSFDTDSMVSKDQSIAASVLDGYLIFIKDMIGNDEIVKHTQQEVGGFLLAKHLIELFPLAEDLLAYPDFKEKIIGTDPAKLHQLKIDIIKFLIALRPELITKLTDSDSISQSWWYLYNGLDSKISKDITNYLSNRTVTPKTIHYILDTGMYKWMDKDHPYNFHFVAGLLEKFDTWSFDISWSYYIYVNLASFEELIENETEIIKEDHDHNKLIDQHVLVAKLIAFSLSTTIHELRDAASVYLVEFGKRFPIKLLELTEYAALLSDTYIYERLTTCCYGVAMILQNNDKFINNELSVLAVRLYNMQFTNTAKHPVLNYIVVDSIKHLVDLAVFKGVLELSEEEKGLLSKYNFNLLEEWNSPSENQLNQINKSSHLSWPEPIGMDFGIYTIPRLINDNHEIERITIANVYKRIFELGFKTHAELELLDNTFREFYSGRNNTGKQGKVDRLGKKYSWKAFFDYAGVLLRQNKLNVFETEGNQTYYERLSDVDIDISMPSKKYEYNERVYSENLLSERGKNSEWYLENKIDSIIPLFVKSFESIEYIMLYGKVEQRIDSEYKVRSYLVADTVFIKKNEALEQIKKAITNRNFDWDDELHLSPGLIRHTYFGELYWSDSMHDNTENEIGIPTGEEILIKRKLKLHDLYNSVEGYKAEDIGKEVDESRKELIFFESESTISEYLWETDSNTIEGFSESFPSVKIGKAFGLKADPLTGRILDSELNECYRCIDFNEDYFENKLNYMRSDLLRKYMDDNNFALLFQIKQHSYDENHIHNRQIKFFIVE